MPRKPRGLTLIELLIALVLLSLVVLGFNSIDLFSRYHVISADRRAKLQNEASFVLEHMSKKISNAVGNRVIAGQNPININPNVDIRVYIDSNADSQGDRWIAYRLVTGQLRYCPDCTGAACGTCNANWEIIARKIAEFVPADTMDNYVDVDLAVRWQPAQPVSVDNPEINMRTRIKMPSVSTN